MELVKIIEGLEELKSTYKNMRNISGFVFSGVANDIGDFGEEYLELTFNYAEFFIEMSFLYGFFY